MKLLRCCTFIILLVKLKRCNEMEPFIVGAQNTPIENFPHAVYLELSTNRKWICGSAILNQDIILTAAHCLYICVDTKCHINAFAGHESLYKVKVFNYSNLNQFILAVKGSTYNNRRLGIEIPNSKCISYL